MTDSSFTSNTNLPTVKDVEEKLQNVQIFPSTERVEINDKLAKIVFSKSLTAGKNYNIVEKKNHLTGNAKHKSSAPLKTKFNISNDNGDEIISLSEFDRAVLSVCISEQKKGNLYTTTNIIFRSLVGKVGEVGIVPRPNQKQAIDNSIITLMGDIIDFENAGISLAEMGYIDDPKDFNLQKSSILPAQQLNCRINGQPVKDVLFFIAQSPLLAYAEPKNQFVRYPADLLDVPDQNNTPLIIMLKTYVIRRIAEIKLHKQMSPTITFDDVFKKCGLIDANKYKKEDARKAIFQLFQHLKDQKYITDYDILKRGNSIYGVPFKK